MKVLLAEKDERDIVQLYKDGASLKEIHNKYHIYNDLIFSILTKNNIHIRTAGESSKIASKKRKLTCLERYGVEYNFQSEETKKKSKLTMLEKYGVEYSALSREIQDKYKQTCLDRYGVDNPNKSKEIRKKTEQTCLNRYGTENPLKAESIKEKIKQTCLERYRVNNPAKSDSVQLKIKLTNLQRCGYSCNLTKSIKDRSLDDWNRIKQKEYLTKKERGTFNTSKPEDEYYKYLLSIYSQDNIIRLYKSDAYPFACDFYIVSEDLYIECNYSWVHGFHLFDKDNEEDLETLEDWKIKAETSDYYKNAIYIWTDLDIRKKDTAKANNLNWIALYNS